MRSAFPPDLLYLCVVRRSTEIFRYSDDSPNNSMYAREVAIRQIYERILSHTIDTKYHHMDDKITFDRVAYI